MKKAMCLFLVCILVGWCLVACSPQTAAETTPTNATTAAPATKASTEAPADKNINPAGELPIVDEQITLDFLAKPFYNIVDVTTNYATLWLEEQTNIHIEWEVLPQTDYRDKVNLLLNSGADLPDCIMGVGFSNAELQAYGGQGIFLPLNPYIDEYGFYLKQWWDYNPDIQIQQTAPDGSIYGIGGYNECFHCWHSQKMWVNQTWMDTLGIEAPTTTEEFYEMLKRFKEEDPNGNGIADEIPMSGTPNSWATNVDGFLMCAFCYNDSDKRLNVVNGQILASFILPEWREGLRYLNKLYTEGLIDSECFVQEESQLKQLVDGDIVMAGAIPAGYPGCFADLNGEGHKNFVALAPLEGPEGVQLTAYYPTQTSGASWVMTRDNEYPAESFRWADYNLCIDAHYRTSFGEEGVDWRLAEPGEVGLDGTTAAIFKELNYLTAGSTPQNKLWSHFFPVWTTNTQFIGRVSDPEDVWYLEARLYKETNNKYMGYDPEDVVMNYYMSAEDSEIYSELNTVINTYIGECIAKFITGEMSLDDDWDSYVAEFNQMGLDEYIALLQKYYDNSK